MAVADELILLLSQHNGAAVYRDGLTGHEAAAVAEQPGDRSAQIGRFQRPLDRLTSADDVQPAIQFLAQELNRSVSTLDLLVYGLVFMVPIAPWAIFGTVYNSPIFNWMSIDSARNRLMEVPNGTSVAVPGAPQECSLWTSGVYAGRYEDKYKDSATFGQQRTWAEL